MAYWLAIGPERNLRLGLDRKIWGMSERYHSIWDKVAKDDVIVFYAMKPTKGIIGYGKVLSRLEEYQPLWDQEVEKGTVLWPLRMKIGYLYALPQSKWNSSKLPLPPLSEGITIQRSFQRLKDNLAKDIIGNLTGQKR